MKIDRRTLTTGVGVIAAAGAAGLYFGTDLLKPAATTSTDGIDIEALHTAGELADMFVGPADAPVTIVEYASMTCPHCAAFHSGTYRQLKENHLDTGAAKLIFREFPLDDLALFAAMILRCADDAKFFPLLDVLFEQQSAWSAAEDQVDALFGIARQAGFTEESFNACAADEDLARAIRDQREKASGEFGVSGTPAFFVNGERMASSSIAAFDDAIAAAAG